MRNNFYETNENGKTPLDYLIDEAELEYARLNNKRKKEKIKEDENYDDILRNVDFPAVFQEGIKLYPCPQPGCNKSFPSLSRIKRHYIIHTGEKPFPCAYKNCNKSFSRRDNMRQHYKSHFKKE